MLTIDDRRTRDIDDAFEVIETQEGWIVKVAISDVGSQVKPGSTTDLVARRRGATRYHARGNDPMLPRNLSDQKLSLWPTYNRKCLGVIITLSKDLEVTAKEMALVVITSQAKLAYTNVPEILKDSEHPQHIQISLARKLTQGLLTKRRNSGAMVFYDLNNGWVTTEDGFLKKLKSREDTIGYIIIQELMILANAAVATLAVEQNVPILFRNHEARSAAPEREALMRQIADAVSNPVLDLETLQKRTHILFDRAQYGSTLLGHYGLNVPAYTHFTSPIRRYADLIVHQQFRARLKGLPLPYTQEQLDEIALHLNNLAQAERDAAKEHFKNKAEERARRNIEAGRLDTLNPKDFERALKVELATGEGPSDALIESWSNRLDDGTVPTACMTELLTTMAERSHEGWEAVLDATLEALDEKAEDAVTVLTQAASLGWKETTYEFVQGGPDHMPSFTATATLPMPQHDTTYTAVATCKRGGTAKLVKQRAAYSLLNLIAHRHELHDSHVSTEVLMPERAVQQLQDFTGKHPVSALMEIHQSKGCPSPKFDFEMSGPPHMPNVSCKGTFLGREVLRNASSKQEAKKLAAQALLDIAQELLS